MSETQKKHFLGLQLLNRAALLRLTVLAMIVGILMCWGWFAMIQMPGESYRDSLPPLTLKEVALQNALQRDVEKIIGSHYDSVAYSPGANDNGTGAAATLELARLFAGNKPARTLRFVEFLTLLGLKARGFFVHRPSLL